MGFTDKQQEFFDNCNHRYNVKSGATRAGKTYMDFFLIPKRIVARRGLDGLKVILGVSKGTISRNIIVPLQSIWGTSLVGDIKTDNTCTMFGEKVYCIGASKINQVAQLRGSSISYCYCDEVVEYSEEVFEMLKSRLDKPYSLADLTCNPDTPTHWFKTFLDGNADIYLQHYTIFDNPFLDEDFVTNLCKEYEGTIYYDRYILGMWKRAEGAIYHKFADNPKSFLVNKDILKNIVEINIGVDFGGNKSGHAFVASAITRGYKELILLEDERHFGEFDSNAIDNLVVKFIKMVIEKYGRVDNIYWDNAETVLGRGITNAIGKEFPYIIVRPAKKVRIKDRIDCAIRLMGSNRFYITESILNRKSNDGTLRDALCDAVWNDKANEDERLDDGTKGCNVDSLDSFEYTYERDIKRLINTT